MTKNKFRKLKEEARVVGYKPLFNASEYKGSGKHHKYKCLSCGITSKVTPSSVRSGSGCNNCAKVKRVKTRIERNKSRIRELHKIAKDKGGHCLEDFYIGVDAKYLFQCKKGHQWRATYYNVVKNGSWCGECYGFNDKTQKLIEVICNRGGTLLNPKKYNKSHTKYKIKCKNNHEFYISYSKLVNSGQWCSICSSGLYERIAKKGMELATGYKFIKARPKWLKLKGNQLELDGYCEELGLAFEHQGIFHYDVSRFSESDEKLKKRKSIDKLKRKLCKQRNIILLEIPELVTTLPIKKLSDYIYKNLKIYYDNLNKFSLKDLDAAYLAQDYREDLKKIADKSGSELLSKSYLGSETLHLFRCIRCNNHYETTPLNIKSSKHNCCPNCKFLNAFNTRNNINVNCIDTFKFNFITDKYDKVFNIQQINNEDFVITCVTCKNKKNYKYSTLKKNNVKCRLCTPNQRIYKYSIEALKKHAISKDGMCLSNTYHGERSLYLWKCNKCNKKWKASWGNVLRGSWCPTCGRKRSGKYTINDCIEYAKKHGGKFLSKKIHNTKELLLWECNSCNKKHTFERSFGSMINNRTFCGKINKIE